MSSIGFLKCSNLCVSVHHYIDGDANSERVVTICNPTTPHTVKNATTKANSMFYVSVFFIHPTWPQPFRVMEHSLLFELMVDEIIWTSKILKKEEGFPRSIGFATRLVCQPQGITETSLLLASLLGSDEDWRGEITLRIREMTNISTFQKHCLRVGSHDVQNLFTQDVNGDYVTICGDFVQKKFDFGVFTFKYGLESDASSSRSGTLALMLEDPATETGVGKKRKPFVIHEDETAQPGPSKRQRSHQSQSNKKTTLLASPPAILAGQWDPGHISWTPINCFFGNGTQQLHHTSRVLFIPDSRAKKTINSAASSSPALPAQGSSPSVSGPKEQYASLTAGNRVRGSRSSGLGISFLLNPSQPGRLGLPEPSPDVSSTPTDHFNSGISSVFSAHEFPQKQGGIRPNLSDSGTAARSGRGDSATPLESMSQGAPSTSGPPAPLLLPAAELHVRESATLTHSAPSARALLPTADHSTQYQDQANFIPWYALTTLFDSEDLAAPAQEPVPPPTMAPSLAWKS